MLLVALLRGALLGNQITLESPGTLRSYVGIDEIGLSIVLSMISVSKAEYFAVGSPRPISMLDLAQCIITYFNSDSSLDLIGDEVIPNSSESWYFPKLSELRPELILSGCYKSAIDEVHDLLEAVKI